jgi:hypothetical protein
MLATCMMLVSTQLELSTENRPNVANLYAKLRNSGIVPLVANGCTNEGTYVLNCTSYLLCVTVAGVGLVGATSTCPPGENLVPSNYTCSASYPCATCTGPNFICLSNTTFTLCAGPGVVVAQNQPCPAGYYCNPKCVSPCLNYIPYC